MDINVNKSTTAEHEHPEEKSETLENENSVCCRNQTSHEVTADDLDLQTLLEDPTLLDCQLDRHAEKLGGIEQTKNDTVSTSSLTATNEMESPFPNEKNGALRNTTKEFAFPSSDKSDMTMEQNENDDEDDDDDDEMEENDGAEYDITTGSTTTDGSGGEMSATTMLQNMNAHSFDDIQFFPASHHRSLRLQPQFQFHHDQLNDPNFHLGPNFSCFDASDLVNLSGSGSVTNNFSLISDSASGDINSAFSESPFVFPDNVMEYGEPQFFPGNCVGYLETILEEDDEEYEEEEGCSGRHWWTADSDTDTDSVIRVDNHGQAQQQKLPSCQQAATAGKDSSNNSVGSVPGEKDEVRPHFRSSASSKPFELEDLHLFDQLDNAFEETLREPKKRSALAFGHQSQSVGQAVESDKVFGGKNQMTTALNSNGNAGASTGFVEKEGGGTSCQRKGSACSTPGTANKTDESTTTGTDHHHVFIESTNNDSKNEMTTKGLKMLTQENVKAHSEENSAKIIYEVGEQEKEQSSKKLGNAESRETFGSSLSPSSSDSEAPAEVAEEDFFYSSPGSEEEECRSQEETESEASCSSSDDSKGVVLAEFSLGPHTGNGMGSGGFNPSAGGIFGGGTRSRRSFDSPSRLKSFRSFDSLNCLAGTELLFSKPDTFPSIHHIKEVSEPSSESESSNEVSVADDRGLVIPEEDEEEEEVEQNNKIEGSQSLPSQHLNTPVTVGFPGPSLNQIGSSNKNSAASSSTSTVSSNASASALRSTENLSEDSGIGHDAVSNTAASTPGAFLEESNVIMSNNVKQSEDCNKATSSPSAPISAPSSATLPASPTGNGQEAVDTSLLLDSAKEYITRAEFALNPFVYSSLSSSEPESSINSAPSLGCNKMSIVKDESLQVQQQLHTTGKMKDMPNNVPNPPDPATAATTTNTNMANAIKNSPHEFVLDCHSKSSSDASSSSVHVQNQQGLSCNEKATDMLLDSSETCTPRESFPEDSRLNSSFNLNPNTTVPLERTGNSDDTHPQLKSTQPLPMSSPVPRATNSQSASTSLSPSCKSNDNGLHEMTLDGSQDKRELTGENNSNPSDEGQPIINNNGNCPVTSIISPTATATYPSASKSANHVNQLGSSSSSVADKLANTSPSTLSPSSVDHTATNDMKANVESFMTAASVGSKMEVKGKNLATTTTAGIPLIHQQDHHQNYNNYNMMTTVMDGGVDKGNTFCENDGHIISSSGTETSCKASPHQPQTRTTIINENERNGSKQANISSSPLSSSATCSSTNGREEEDGQSEKMQKPVELGKEMSPATTPNASCVGARGLLAEVLSMPSVDDAEGEAFEEKHASLQLSSSSLSCAADSSFSACPLTQLDQQDQNQKHSSSSSYSSSSSSSGDEQNEHISSQQPRFRRQRSDSESEYEAAESAVERNNVDMAYDIIVNSPSKKQAMPTVASSISSLSGVVGATTGMTVPTTETITSSSSFSAMSSSLAHAQPVVSVEEISGSKQRHTNSENANNVASSPISSALTPAQDHSQSQSETNANKCDNMKSGPVSTLDGSLISIHRNDNMHDVLSQSTNSTSRPTAAFKGENINKYNATTATASTQNYEDKKLPVFESCLDDYDDDDIVDNDNVSSISTCVAPQGIPMITENMQSNKATNNTHPTNNIFIAVSSYTHKTVCSNSSHEAGQMRNVTHAAALAVNGKQHLAATKQQAPILPSSSPLPASSSSSFPLEKQQPHRHEIENTSLLLHHQQLSQRQCNNQREQYENSDELTSSQVALPQSHSHFSLSASATSGDASSGGIIGGSGAHRNNREQHKGFIVTGDDGVVGKPVCGAAIKNKNCSGHVVEAQHQQKQDHHHQQSNVVGSVTLDDSTSADVAHNDNLQLNQREKPVLSCLHPAGSGGATALKSNSAQPPPRLSENYSKASSLNQHSISNKSPYQIAHNNRSGSSNNHSSQSSYLDNGIDPGSKLALQQQRHISTETSCNNTKGYHHHHYNSETGGDDGNNKVVIAEPYYPNQIGVAEVKKFLAGFVPPKECVSFSGPVGPPTYYCASDKEFESTLENNNKQRKTEPAEFYHSQSVENVEKSASSVGPTTTTIIAAKKVTDSQANTGGRERVILGDSNFGFFGCSSSLHSRSSASSNGNITDNTTTTDTTRRGALESVFQSQNSVVPTVLPQVNLDLHTTSNESGFSSGYGFPCPSHNTSAHSQQKQQPNTWLGKEQEQHQLRLPLKENNTFCPSSVEASGSGSISTSIKSSASPSSSSFGFSLTNNTRAAQESSKDLGKQAAAAVVSPPPPPLRRRDQPHQQQSNKSKDTRQQQQQHLHLEDISLYAGLDKFSVPLGAIKAAVVAVAPTIPSYIVGPGSHNNGVEKNASKLQNSDESLVQTAGKSSKSSSIAAAGASQQISTAPHAEANGNLSKEFPKGTITTCAKNNSLLDISSSSISCNSVSRGSNTLPKGGENNESHGAIVPDILILKQFPYMPANAPGIINSSGGRISKEAERITTAASAEGVMEFDIASSTEPHRNPDGSNSGISGNARNISQNKKRVKERDSQSGNTSGSNINTSSNVDSISSGEMLRSNSPTAPSGLPHKTKTYGRRNEVEVVVVSSRTPSPAPGGFVSTSSSFPSSSQKLPFAASPASTSAGQQRNEPAFSPGSTAPLCYDEEVDNFRESSSSSGGGGGDGGILRESSIPPPPSSPSPTPASGKATRSRVHFSPVVSEISWRESYIDQSSECSGSTEDLLAKLDILDADGNPVVRSHRSGKSDLLESNCGNNHSASANLRKAGAFAAAGVGGGSGSGVVRIGDNSDGVVGSCDVGSSAAVRPLQVYDIQMSTRADSPSSLVPTRGQIPTGKCPILVEKVEMRSSPLHDHDEHEDEQIRHIDRPLVLGESQSSRKLILLDDGNDDDEEEDQVDNDPERVTDLVDFRHNSNNGTNGGAGNNSGGNEQNNGTLGLYEDVDVQIEPTTNKSPGSTTLSMVPDLLSQCENTNNTLTHIDVKIEETVPGLHTKNIVLNIGPSSNTNRDIQQSQRQQPQKIMQKSQSPQPQEMISPTSGEPRQIFPKMFAEDSKNDNKRNTSSSSSLSSTSKGKKNAKGFIIQGLGSSSKKSEKDAAKDMGGLNGNHGSAQNSNVVAAPAPSLQNVEQTGGGVAETAKENKKSSKPGFFERLSKIRLSSGSKNKKQKVHPKTDEIHQEGDSSGPPPVTTTIGGASNNRPLRSANSVNLNGNGNASSKHGNNSGANNAASSQIANNHPSSGASSSGGVQPILKKSTTATSSASTIPSGVGPHYNNGSEMGMIGDSENEPDEAAQAFENILEEIAGLKSIQLRQEKSSSSSIDKSPSSQQVRSFAKRKQFYSTNNAAAAHGSPSPPVSPQNSSSRSYSDLDSKLSQFKEDASRTLDTISKSHPDLEIIEDAVRQRQKSLSPEPTMHDLESTRRPGVSTLPKTFSSKSPSYAATEAAQNSEREWYRLLKSATEKFSYPKGPKDEHLYNRDNTNPMLVSHKTGIVETDLDTGASREMLDEDMLQLDCKVPCYTVSTSEIPTTSAAASTSAAIVTTAGSPGTAAKTRSLTNLSTRLPLSIAPSSQFEESTGDLSDSEERAKSLEFLLDDNHKSSSVPPENKLRLETRQLSEHELRIQRSLQRLNLPEWYKQHGTVSTTSTAPIPATMSNQSKSGTLSILNKRSDYGSSGGLAGGWSGLSTYKAPSMSSLQSNGGRSSGTLNKNFVRGRPATMSVTRTSKESLLASGSASHSPSAFERSSFTYGMPFTMTRFGHGRLSTHSSSVSPPSTPDSTAKASSYVKKPYLGWRSQEKLNAGGAASTGSSTGPPKLSIYLPPAERLAADLLATRAKSPHPPVRPPVSDRPPLPRAPPRSDRTALSKQSVDDSHEVGDGRASSPVISKQTSSLAVVTKLPQSQQSSSIPPPEFSQGNYNEGVQSQTRGRSLPPRITSDVHDSIRQVTSAISHYVGKGNETQSQPKAGKPKSGKKQAIWIESSFVGQKPPTK